MLLTQQFCKKVSSDYEKLINEEGYFDNDRPARRSTPVAAVKKYVFNNMPMTAEALITKLTFDKSRVAKMSDAVGQEIVQATIAKLEAFLTTNNIEF